MNPNEIKFCPAPCKVRNVDESCVNRRTKCILKRAEPFFAKIGGTVGATGQRPARAGLPENAELQNVGSFGVWRFGKMLSFSPGQLMAAP